MPSRASCGRQADVLGRAAYKGRVAELVCDRCICTAVAGALGAAVHALKRCSQDCLLSSPAQQAAKLAAQLSLRWPQCCRHTHRCHEMARQAAALEARLQGCALNLAVHMQAAELAAQLQTLGAEKDEGGLSPGGAPGTAHSCHRGRS